MKMMVVFFGPAGSGKSTLTGRFGEWLKKEGYEVFSINLDPGAEVLPYIPDFDVRRYFTLVSIMRRENLGPNGAFLRSMELLPEIIEKWHSNLIEKNVDFLLIDTPGQLEAFLLHPGGIKTVNALGEIASGRIMGLFLLNADFLTRVEDVAMLSFFALAFQLRFHLQVLPVISKADVLPQDIEKEPLDLDVTLETISKREGSQSAILAQILEIVEGYGLIERIIKLSAFKSLESGLYELYSLIHEAFCTCGDL